MVLQAAAAAAAAAVNQHSNPWAILNKLSIAEWLRAHGKFVRPELTKKQRLELKECFELIDADGSGAISSSEMLTAFHVLGIRTKRSEVEEMLSEVDADGSGEVEYPEFVQIMTTKMDSQNQEEEPRTSRPGKAQPLPFPLLAQAYRRKKLMEAVMQGDKATQERLQARAEEMEQERIAAIAEHEARKSQVKKRRKSLTQMTKDRIRRAARLKRKDTDMPLPLHALANIHEDIQKVLFGVQERASVRRSSMSQAEKEGMAKEKGKKGKERRASYDDAVSKITTTTSDTASRGSSQLEGELDKGFSGGKTVDPPDARAEAAALEDQRHLDKRPSIAALDLHGAKRSSSRVGEHSDVEKEFKRFTISDLNQSQVDQLSEQMQTYFKDEVGVVKAARKKLRDKPTLEQQRIKQTAIQSLGTYYVHDKERRWDVSGSPILRVDPVEKERIHTPWRIRPRVQAAAGSRATRNSSHARIIYVPPPKPVKDLRFKEQEKPEWINYLHKK